MKKIAEEIKSEPQDAYISKEPLKVHVDKDGVELGISIEDANNILKENKEEYEIPLKIIKAKS